MHASGMRIRVRDTVTVRPSPSPFPLQLNNPTNRKPRETSRERLCPVPSAKRRRLGPSIAKLGASYAWLDPRESLGWRAQNISIAKMRSWLYERRRVPLEVPPSTPRTLYGKYIALTTYRRLNITVFEQWQTDQSAVGSTPTSPTQAIRTMRP